jgi:hypothetical protein
VEQAPGEDRGSGEEQADGLVAVELRTLGFAVCFALLLDGEAFQFVFHAGTVLSAV